MREGGTLINNWECAPKSQHNLWKHNQERLKRCENRRIQMEIFYGKSCFVSYCLPSGLWVPMFSHSWTTWACISSSFIFPEHARVVWPVTATAQLVGVVPSRSLMARVHLQNHLIPCQVPEHDFKCNLELLWTEGFKCNDFLCSRFWMLKEGGSQYANKGVTGVILKIRWANVR